MIAAGVIGDILCAARRKIGASYKVAEEIASRYNVTLTPVMLHRIEQGKENVTLDIFMALIDFYGLEIIILPRQQVTEAKNN